VAKFLAIPKTDLSKLQVVQEGEGRHMIQRMPYNNWDNDDKNPLLDLSRPILIHDTPESIGMKFPITLM
jgi:hypothetical protein